MRKYRSSSRSRLTRNFSDTPYLGFEVLEDRMLLSASIPLNALSWTALGPAPINNGQVPGSSPVSGRIAGLAAHPTDANTIYVATAGGGVWKTTDGGANWSPKTDTLQTLVMGSIAIAPSNTNVVYAGTGEVNNSGDSFYGRGVLKSTDGGATWTMTGNAQFNRHTIAKVVVDPVDANRVYVAVDGFGVNGLNSGGVLGVWRTTDGGTNWSRVLNPQSAPVSGANPQMSDLLIDPTTAGATGVLYAAVGTYFGDGGNGVYKSIDGGASWAVAGDFPRGTTNGRIAMAISASSTGTLYAARANPSTGAVLSIHKTTNGGGIWTATSLPDNYLSSQGWYDTTIAVNSTDPNIVYAGGAGDGIGGYIVKSIDGGASWTTRTDIRTGVNGGGPHADHHGIGFDANGKLLVGTDGGLWRLDDPNVGSILWTNLNGSATVAHSALNTIQFTGIALHPTNPNIAFGGSQDNGTERFDDALGWTRVASGDGGFTRVAANSGSTVATTTVYHSFQNNFLEKSTNGGATWSSANVGVGADPSNFYVPYVVSETNPSHLLRGTNRVYTSTNAAGSWAPISTTNTAGWSTTANISTIGLAEIDSNTIYAGTNNGKLFVTTDGGSNWTSREPGLLSWKDIAVDPTNAQIAYIVAGQFRGAGGNVFTTANGGVSWTNITNNLPDLPVQSVLIDPRGAGSTDDVLYVGTDDGVYSSANLGTTWARFGGGLPNVQVVDLDLAGSLGILAAGTHGRGLWEIITNAVIVTPSGGSTDVREGGFTDTYTLALSTVPAGSVQVTVTADAQTQVSTDGVNFSSSRVLSFSNTSAQTVTVRAIDDTVYEGPHTSTITHSITATNDPSFPVGLVISSIVVNITDNDLSPFVRQQPFGSLVGTSLATAGAIFSAADEATFAVSLPAGQRISASINPTNSSVLSIQLVGVTGLFTAPSAGATAVLPVTAIAASGVYTLRVTGNAASNFSLNAFLNSISEATDSTNASKLAIDASVLSLGSGRYAVVGDARPVASPTIQLTKSNNPSLFVDISSTGTPLGLSDDGFAIITTTVGNSVFPAGSVLIDNNGVIVIGGTQAVNFNNFALPTILFGNALVPFWDDLDDAAGNVFWQQRQINGINALVVQWENRPHFNNVGNVTFQVQVFESGPVQARYAYKDVDFGNATLNGGASATVGLQLATNSALQYSFNTASLIDGDVLDFVRPVTPDVDEYTVDLTGHVGKPIDIILAGIGNDFSDQQLQLIGVDGSTVLATGTIDPVQAGTNASNMDLAILGFAVPVNGVYTIRVTSAQTSGKYVIAVSSALALEAEPNNLASNPLRSISVTKPALGSLNIIGDQDDHYSISLTAGEVLTLITTTPFDSASSPLLNTLNPELTVIHPNGTTTVGADLDSSDGKNARLTFTAPVTGTYTVRVRATAGNGEYSLVLAQATIAGRNIFYDNSFFDGNTAGADAGDDGARDSDKVALRSGTATLSNFTNYFRGINGVMVDIANLAGTMTAADFEFRVGNTDTPNSWATGPAPTQVTVRPGAGAGGSSRVTLVWPDNAIEKTWLQVTVKANSNTGLAAPDVFYFGNAVGDIGNSTTDAIVNATDIAGVVRNQNSFLNPAPLTSPYDFNHDRQINATDIATAVANQTSFLNALRMISLPSGGSAARAASGWGEIGSNALDSNGNATKMSAFEHTGPLFGMGIMTTASMLSEPLQKTQKEVEKPSVSLTATQAAIKLQHVETAFGFVSSTFDKILAMIVDEHVDEHDDDFVARVDELMADLDLFQSFLLS